MPRIVRQAGHGCHAVPIVIRDVFVGRLGGGGTEAAGSYVGPRENSGAAGVYDDGGLAIECAAM